MAEAQWTNGKRTVSGRWFYYRPGDFFSVELDQRDRTTGERTKIFRVYGDSPEWGKFRLVRKGHKWAPIMDGKWCCQFCMVDYGRETSPICEKAPASAVMFGSQ